MADAPSSQDGEAEKAKVNLEDLFNDEDSDNEFSSSAPQLKSEEVSQPIPLYVYSPSSL
jgi:DNA primase small subunit